MKWTLRTTKPGSELAEQGVTEINILEVELTTADIGDILRDHAKTNRIRIDDKIHECGIRLSRKE